MRARLRNLWNHVCTTALGSSDPNDVGLGLVELLVGGAVLILIAWLLFRR